MKDESELEGMCDKGAMDREKVKGKRGLRNKVVGEWKCK